MSTDPITLSNAKLNSRAVAPLTYRRMLLYAAFGTTIALLILGVLISVWLWQVKDYGVTVDWDGHLLAVAPGSRADLAGVRPGDSIQFIDFQRLKQLSGQSQIGQLVDMAVWHNGIARVVTLEARPSDISQRIDRGVIPLVGMGFILLGIAPLIARRRNFTLWMFFLATQITGLFLMAERPRALHLFWAEVITYITLALFPAVLFHFHTLFPQPKFGRWRRPLVLAMYAWGACIIPFNWPGLFDWNYHTSDIEIVITEIYLSGVLLACLAMLVHTYRTTQDRRVRTQLKIITLCSGLGLGITPVLMVAALLFDLSVSNALENLSVIAALTTPIGYAYAMLRYDLLIDGLLWRRWLIRAAISSILIIGGLAVGAMLLAGVPVSGGTAIVLGVLVSLGAVIMGVATTWAGERLEERVFKGSSHIDFLDYATGELERFHNLEEYVQFFVQALPARLKISGALVFLAPEQEDSLQLYGTSTSLENLIQEADIPALPLTSDLCTVMQSARTLIPLATLFMPQAPAFSEEEAQFLQTLSLARVEVLMPLVSPQQTRLIGVVALGTKETDDAYSSQEITALTALARTAATSAENVLLFEAQEKQLAELKEERENSATLARYINSAQDEARKRISRDLHDHPLQELGVLQRALSKLREQVQDALVQFVDLELSLEADSRTLDPAILTRISTLLGEGQRRLEIVLGEDVEFVEDAASEAGGTKPTSDSLPPLESHPTIEGLIEQVDATAQQLRAICNNLHPTYLKDPLATTVRNSVERIRKQNPNITFQADIQGTERQHISDNVKMACKEVMDQAIRNAIAHGRATQIQVQVAFATPGAITLRVVDNGAGFIPEPPRRLRTKGHHGLANMAERAELAGGKLQINSTPNQGTLITLHIPLQEDKLVSARIDTTQDMDAGGEQVLPVIPGVIPSTDMVM